VTGGAYLLVLGERDAIAWVLREQRMAFPATPRAEVAGLAEGDRLFLYTTRGAWHNPTRDRGRIIGTARVASPIRLLDAPIEIAGMRFHSGCDLQIGGVVAYPGGVEVQPLVRQLAAFPKPDAWSAYLRRSLVRLPDEDAVLIERALTNSLVSRDEALSTYPRVSSLTSQPWVCD
jgi:hypothetical protein